MSQQFRLNYEDLGIDIWMHVMYFLKPFDILGLRQTCRFFHQATSHRTVWLAAVNTMGPSTKDVFPVNRMDRRSLEHTALAPARFSALISENYHSPSSPSPFVYPPTGPSVPLESDWEAQLHPIYPDSARVLPKSNKFEKQLAVHGVRQVLSEYESTKVFAAGRFLLTIAGAVLTSDQGPPPHALFVQLWDLGTPVLGDRMRLLTSATLKHRKYVSSVLYPITEPPETPELTYILLLETLDDESISGCRLSVYTVTVFDAAPTFKLQNDLYLPDGLINYFTDGSRIAVLNILGAVWIWDWANRMATSFHSSLDFSNYVNRDTDLLHTSSMVVHEDNFLISYEGFTYQWRLPEPISQSKLQMSGKQEVIHPHRSVQYASPEELADLSDPETHWQGVVTFLSWKPFDPLKLLVINEDKLVLYDVALTPSLSETSQLRKEVHLSVNNRATLSESLTWSRYGWDADICEGHLTFTSDHRDRTEAVVMHMIPLREANAAHWDAQKQFLPDNPTDCDRKGILSESENAQGAVSGVILLPGFSICGVRWSYLSPWTGRVCHSSENGDFYVLEYLKPPMYHTL